MIEIDYDYDYDCDHHENGFDEYMEVVVERTYEPVEDVNEDDEIDGGLEPIESLH